MPSSFLAGIVTAVAILNALVIFVVKERNVLVQAALCAVGLAFYADRSEEPLFAWLFIAGTVYFATTFLRLREYDELLDSVLLLFSLAGASFPLVVRFAPQNTVLISISWGILALTMIGVVAAGVRAFQRGFTGARFFVVATAGACVSMFVTDFGYGIAWQALWFTIALADRVTFTGGENRQAARVRHAELEVLAEMDALTGVPNRRAFDERLEAEWERALHSGGWIGIIMIDVDHFKDYNDELGHIKGDLALTHVAKACAGALKRAGDFFARYGGEEFAAILATQNDSDLMTIAERMRQAVCDAAIAHPKNAGGIVTISLGTARVRPTSTSMPIDLIGAADDALYQAKSNGRNCVRAA